MKSQQLSTRSSRCVFDPLCEWESSSQCPNLSRMLIHTEKDAERNLQKWEGSRPTTAASKIPWPTKRKSERRRRLLEIIIDFYQTSIIKLFDVQNIFKDSNYFLFFEIWLSLFFTTILLYYSFMFIFLFVVLAGWTLIMFFSYRYLRKILNKYRNIERIPIPPQYDCFKKEDLGKWNENAILKGFFFNYPINLMTLTTFILIFALLCLLRKHLGLPAIWVDTFRRKAGRWLLKSRVNLIEEFNSEQEIDTPIVISNHVCWFDMAYMGSCFRALSFVAKR